MGLVHIIRKRANSAQQIEETSQNVAAIQINSDIKFPSVNLPKFSGQYSEWLNFSKNFKELIASNSRLSEQQKYLYLKSCLSGPAAAAVESVEINENSYKEAWEILQGKFRNSKFITDLEIRNILSLEKITNRSFEHFQKLFDLSFNSIRKLSSITEKEKLSDALLVYLVTSKFDHETKQLWELSLPANELPSLTALEDFMSRQCQSLNAIFDKDITSKSSKLFSKQSQ